ncbi:MAG: VWA domain-containing protein [Bacteroidota bacterium]|nr:VWA domain-containing protein [Bacteroidota bacterium]
MLRYEHIEYLNLLFGIPILILAIILYSKWKKNALTLFGDIKLLNKLTHSLSKTRYQIKNIFTILIFILLIIGISNPQIGTKMEEVKREGVDLIIAIDLSYSMMAEDIKPNRLKRAKQAISNLINKLEGDRIGLIVFAGEAYVQLPITTDYSAAKLFLSTVNTTIVPTQGTEIAKAIDLSIESFDMENGQNKAIIIITDGESHDENAIESAKKANEVGIFVHTLGMGLSKGGPIPIYNKYGTRTDYRKDREGNTIISKLNENLLKQIANAGKGTYVRANNSKAGLSSLFAEINKMEKKEIGTMVFTNYKDRFQLFIGLALLILILDLILLPTKSKWSNRINLYKKE